MTRKLVLVLAFACLAVVGGFQLGTPAPASAATINMTATCGSASYVGGRLRQEFNVTINGPAVGAGQQFSTSGWTMNTAPQFYFNSTPSPGTTPYPFSGTMTADLIDDPFNPGQTATNPAPGSNPPYTLMTYITNPLGSSELIVYHSGYVVVNCPVPAIANPLAASNFTISGTSGQTITHELDDHISGGSAPFNFSIVTPPTNGTLTMVPSSESPFAFLAGTFRYRTVKSTAGTDSFVYQVSDSTGTIKTGTATINYAAPPPVVVPARTLDVAHGGSGTLTLAASGGIGTKTISLVTTSPSTKGTFSLTGTTFNYQAGAGQFGTDTITYRATDQTDPSQIVTNTITVIIAPPPVVAGDFTLSSQVAFEGSTTGNVANLSSGGQPPLAYIVASAPTKGTVTINPATGGFTYDANDGATGTDSFVYRASDSSSTPLTDTGTISLTIAPAPLTGVDSSLTVVAGSTASIDVATLIDGGTTPFTYSASDPPKGGVDIVGSVYTYTADIDERGADSFTYTVLDAGVGGNSQTVMKTISVTIIDPPIVIAPPSVTSVTAGQSTTIDLIGNATGGTGNLTYTIDSQGTKGTSALTGKSLTYNANAADRGTDSITILVTDESPTPQTQTMTVPILITAPQLVVEGTTASVEADQSVDVDVAPLISGGTGPFEVSIDTNGMKGTATVTGSEVTYLANAADRGADSIVFRITDASDPVQSVTAEIGITITAPPLILTNPAQSVVAGETLTINLASLVSGGTPGYTYSLVSGPAHGLFGLTGSTLTFTPDADYRGADSFTYQVVDESDPVQTQSVEISILVTAPELVLGAPNQTVTAGQLLTLDLSTLVTGGTANFAYSLVSGPANGLFDLTDSTFTYTPGADFRGLDGFTFQVVDESDPVQTKSATVSILVTAPLLVVSDGSATVEAGQSIDIDVTSLISGGTAPFIVSIEADGIKGSSVVNSTGFSYTANAGDRQGDTVTFRVTDVSDPIQSVTADIAISITAPELVLANPDLSVTAGQLLTVELAPLVSGGTPGYTYSLISGPAHGLFGLTGSTFTYTPDADYRGGDSFTYQVVDESAPIQTKSAQISILVTAPLLVLTDTTGTVIAGQGTTTDVSSLISGGTGPFVLSVDTQGAKGSTAVSGLTFTYTANSADRGQDTMVYRITDSSDPVQSVTAELDILITAPELLLGNPAQSVTAGQTLTLDLATLVSGGTPNFAYSLTTDPAHGSFELVNSTISYTPPADYRGVDSFTYQVVDESDPVQTKSATISIMVTAPALVVASNSGSVLASNSISFDLSSLVSGGTADFSYAIEADGTKGSSSLTGTTLTYTANSANRGADTVTFRVTDESDPVQTMVGTLSILITAPDLIVSDTSANLTAGESVGVDLSSLVSGGTPGFSYSVASGGAKGTTSISGSTLNYSANAGDRGSDTVEVNVTDSSDPQQSGIITIAIGIEAPTLSGGGTSIEVGAGQSGSVNLAALLSGGTGPFSFSVESAPAFGSASISGSSATYSPNHAFEGLDNFKIRATDSSSPQQSALLSISVSVVAPQVSDQTVWVTGDPRFPITGSAAIGGFDGLTYTLLSTPAIGSATVASNGGFTYTIGSTMATGTSFTVLATDIYGNTAVVTVVLTFDVDETVPTSGTVTPPNGKGGGKGGGSGTGVNPRPSGQPQQTPVDNGDDDDDTSDGCARCG